MKEKTTYNLKIFNSTNELNIAAAKFIIEIAHKAITEKGKFTISLSGGNTPTELYTLLSEPFYRYQIVWDKTFIFWGDERFVPPDDPNNNAYQAKLALLDKITIPKINIHPIPTDSTPTDAARQYEVELKTFFGADQMQFDIILLGLGENGHTASLFPGASVLEEKSAGIREVYLTEENKYRITMTAPLINMAKRIVFLIAGEKKAEIVKEIFTTSKKYPAQLIQPINGELTWLMDKKAASLLKAD